MELRPTYKKHERGWRAVIVHGNKVVWEGRIYANRSYSTMRNLSALDAATTVLRAINGEGETMMESVRDGFRYLSNATMTGNVHSGHVAQQNRRLKLVEYAIAEADKFNGTNDDEDTEIN